MRPAPSRASVSRRNFFFSSEAMSHCRHCAKLKHAASPEPKIWMRSAYTFNSAGSASCTSDSSPEDIAVWRACAWLRLPDFLYDLFRDDERIRRQFSEQIQSTDVNEIDKDVRVGYNDTNNETSREETFLLRQEDRLCLSVIDSRINK